METREKRIEKKQIKDYTFIIEEAIKCLPNGEFRLAVSDHPLSYVCLNEFLKPDPTERLVSDYGVSSRSDGRIKDIEKDYYEEITTIEKIMIEADVPISLADWQSGLHLESAEKMYKSANRRAYAMQMWSCYGIPWRYKDGLIYLIWPPTDLLGTPIIHGYKAEDFLSCLARIQENQIKNLEGLTKKLNFWQKFGAVVTFILFLLLIITLSLIYKFIKGQ